MTVKKKSWDLSVEELTDRAEQFRKLHDTKKKAPAWWHQFPPPFKVLTPAAVRRLGEKFNVHPNPDPPDCEYCGLKYKDLKTGLDFQMVKDMLWIADEDPDRWRHKGRHSVLGLWFEIKRSMWEDHIAAHEHEDDPWVDEYLAAFDGEYEGSNDPQDYEESLDSTAPPF